MNLTWKSNGFRMTYQIVLSIAEGTSELTLDEREMIRDAVFRIASKPGCRIVEVNCGSTWVEYIADADPGFDPVKLIRIVKSETTYLLKSRQSGNVWARNYVVTTLGDRLPAYAAADELRSRSTGTTKGKTRN